MLERKLIKASTRIILQIWREQRQLFSPAAKHFPGKIYRIFIAMAAHIYASLVGIAGHIIFNRAGQVIFKK
jgi:hypothetical protein